MTETFPTFTLTRKGETFTFTSKFATLAEAYKALASHDASFTSDFARDLLAAARERRLSQKQAAWLHKLATDAVTPKSEKPRAGTIEIPELTDLFPLFDRAAEAQKRSPRIVLCAPNGQKVVLSRCGPQSQYTGDINVTDGGGYGRNTWFGRIGRTGEIRVNRSAWTPEITSLLTELAVSPGKVAGQHGIATGVCCFCNSPLSTKESRSVGYGPICADKFGLPWGTISQEVKDADAAAKAAFQEQPAPACFEPDSRTQELIARLFESSERTNHDYGRVDAVVLSYPHDEQDWAVNTIGRLEDVGFLLVHAPHTFAVGDEPREAVQNFTIRAARFEEFKRIAKLAKLELTSFVVEVIGRLFESSDGNGHDFGLACEVITSFPAAQRDDVEVAIENIEAAGFITVYEPHRINDDEWVTQFAIDPDRFEEFKRIANRELEADLQNETAEEDVFGDATLAGEATGGTPVADDPEDTIQALQDLPEACQDWGRSEWRRRNPWRVHHA